MPLRIAYLSLQATCQGQASYAHVHEIIHGLQRHGCQVKLHEPRYDPNRPKPGIAWRLLHLLAIQLRLWRQEQNADVLYIRNHPLCLPSVFWARLKRIPVVQEINGPIDEPFMVFPWSRWFKSLLRTVFALALEKSDAIIAVTQELGAWARKAFPSLKTFVIPNGANTTLFSPDALPASPIPTGPYALFFGALAPWQGIETMLAAVQHPAWPSDVKLVIVGDGVERPKIDRAAQEGLVVSLGRLPYEAIPGLIVKSIAGISAQNNAAGRSNTGLSPLKVFETLACGVPVIVSDFPGMAELVRLENCGKVIPAENPRALAEAVAYLYAHPQERLAMGIRGRKAIAREHSWDARSKATLEALSHFLHTSQSDSVPAESTSKKLGIQSRVQPEPSEAFQR